MPMRSQKQRRYLHATHPELAKEFESKTPKGKKLPVRVRKKRKKS
jgi:hypothetical protein